MKKKEFYFSTRDLMMMAALSALGGVTSTYVNMIGDFFQSLLGFAGTTQWAAGLHVIWLMLASALVGKPGAATLTGIIKGFVELFTGNTHGILVVIVDIVAGLVVDLILLLSRDKRPNLLFYLAAGLSSASNVVVFQVFASLPADVLAFFAIIATSALAFGSGVLFGGVMTHSLVKALEKIGVIRKKQIVVEPGKRIWAAGLIVAAVIAVMAGGYSIYSSQTRVSSITISGDVQQAYDYPPEDGPFIEKEVEIESGGAVRKYKGIALKDIVDFAQPVNDDGVVLIEATDGYSFFVSMEEINTNENLLLVSQESDGESVFNVVGAASTKACVRGVSRIAILPKDTLEVGGNAGNPFIFAPQDWQDKMDSIYFSIDDVTEKLQGVPIYELINQAQPLDAACSVVFENSDASEKLDCVEIADNNDVRLFTYPKESGFEFILARMDGSVLLRHVASIEIE